MKISPARVAAYQCLLRVERDRVFSSTVLSQVEEELSSADGSLCHQLVLGVLRRQMLLDAYIDVLTGGKKLDSEVRIILRLGLFQIAHLDRVPEHAIVNDSVNLTTTAKKTSAKGMVNAVLRKATREMPELKFRDDDHRAIVETSHPEWLLRRWMDQFGTERALELAASNNEPPLLAFRKTVRGVEIEFEESYRVSELVPGCFFTNAMDQQLRDLSNEGLIYFQDEGSQLVASAIKLKGPRFLDVCASPGGKTTAVAVNIRSGRFQIFAGDLTDRRVDLLKKTCKKQGADLVKIAQYDASTSLPFADSGFDTVLVDAPCTGTGTIRHNPEIRYFIKESDFEEIAHVQLSILKNASMSVRSGGSLIYSTCSLETEENEGVVSRFLQHCPDFRSVKTDVPDRFLVPYGFARTFPPRDHMDGFFIATLTRG